jgi:hypothetical protein
MPLLKELIVIQIIVSFLDFKKQVQKGKWSWDQILQDQKSFLMRLKEQSWDQKSFFQEIKCAVFYETKKLLIMLFWVLISWMISYSQVQSWDWKSKKHSFWLLISLSKLPLQKCSWDQKSKKHYFWLSISWKICYSQVQSWNQKFLCTGC